jgi:adenine-specific DNA-methyltransferase
VSLPVISVSPTTASPTRSSRAAWAELYLTVSRPFEAPATGRIAIKVINHYGDEVLKVYDV